MVATVEQTPKGSNPDLLPKDRRNVPYVSGSGAERKCLHGSLRAAIRCIPENICSPRAFLRLALADLPKRLQLVCLQRASGKWIAILYDGFAEVVDEA